MSSKQLLDVSVSSGIVSITIGSTALLNFLKTSENWPVNEYTDKPLKIEDRELFIDEFTTALVEEDAFGITPIHRVFEEALASLVESGSSALQENAPAEEDTYAEIEFE